MGAIRRRNRAELKFVAALAVVCCGLTVLQFHWTGELAQAEMDRMAASLQDQASRLSRAFDSELTQSCAALIPSGAEIARDGSGKVHKKRLKEWKATRPRPIFKRIAVAKPLEQRLEFSLMNLDTGKLEIATWPAGWEELRANLEDKMLGGLEPFADRSGLLMEFPVMTELMVPGDIVEFSEQVDTSGVNVGWREEEWIIVELDTDYIRNVWLPHLVGTYLNHGELQIHDITVRPKVSHEVIFTTASDGSAQMNTVSIDFNFHGLSADNPRGRPQEAFWVLEVGRREGALEEAVAGSRYRNLAVAIFLNGLIIVAGVMLLRATGRSRQLAEERMKFVANVTHELRTPLTVIRGAAHNMKRGIVKDTDGVTKYSSLILEHAEALGEMVEQVLDFSVAQRGLLGAERHPVDIGATLRAAVSAVTSGGRNGGCEVDVNIQENLPPVTGDGGTLKRAFINLIENAIKHGGSGGWVGVSAKAEGRQMVIRVIDRGPGIPVSERPDIFNPFFRGDAARSKQVRGSGLGLSLVKEIALAHGGTVVMEGGPGIGSVFIFTLPIEPRR